MSSESSTGNLSPRVLGEGFYVPQTTKCNSTKKDGSAFPQETRADEKPDAVKKRECFEEGFDKAESLWKRGSGGETFLQKGFSPGFSPSTPRKAA